MNIFAIITVIDTEMENKEEDHQKIVWKSPL